MSEEKPKFYNTPVGKILMNGIHDHAVGISLLGCDISLLEKYLEKGTLTNEKVAEIIKNLEYSKDKLKESIDYIYENIKKEMGY